MDNIENLELLAKTSFSSKNYEQAYNYYSRLLETDVANKSYWIMKGISSSNLSTLKSPRITESITCIDMAKKIESLSNEDKCYISDELINAAKQKITEGILFIDNEIEREYNSLQIPTGTLYEVQKLRKLPIMSSVGQKYRLVLIEYFELMNYAGEINPTIEVYKSIIEQFNKVFEHSKSRNNYFGGVYDNDYNKKIFTIWNNAKENLSVLDPEYKIEAQNVNNSEGCFIATAAAGNYNHSTVLDLRGFRDDVLKKTKWGNKFILFYYKNSPPIADYIRDRNIIRKIVYFVFILPLSKIVKSIK